MNIIVRNLKKNIYFGNRKYEVIKDATMEFESGKIVSIVGESGSGKSTLLNILSLLDDADEGEYMWDDVNLTKADDVIKNEYLANKIGIVFQQYNLIDNMTCFDNVKMPLYLNKNVARSERSNRVNDILMSMGIYDRKEHYPNTLSGGEQQRAAIARALINEPDVIFADEPTGNVDTSNERQILEIFRTIANKGKIVVIVTHSEKVMEYSDKVYRIVDGVVYENEVMV